jgi:hypothetical protein
VWPKGQPESASDQQGGVLLSGESLALIVFLVTLSELLLLLLTNQTKGSALMFDSLTSKVVTAVCAVVDAIALLGTFFLTMTGGLPYLQFALALIFFAMFIMGSYWWMVFRPGSKLQGGGSRLLAQLAECHRQCSIVRLGDLLRTPYLRNSQ